MTDLLQIEARTTGIEYIQDTPFVAIHLDCPEPSKLFLTKTTCDGQTVDYLLDCLKIPVRFVYNDQSRMVYYMYRYQANAPVLSFYQQFVAAPMALKSLSHMIVVRDAMKH